MQLRYRGGGVDIEDGREQYLICDCYEAPIVLGKDVSKPVA
ncbi:MAG TPA: hypothetical protein VFC10_01155 [Terriglobia bacterium]|jgi:hypothetical protein|nr:hypothetical protein [Terriglobia bacterium]